MTTLIERIRAIRVLALVSVAAVSSACVIVDYPGDGKLVYNGPLAAKDRYVLDLGPIDLGRTGKYVYTIRNLPIESYAVGLEIVEEKPNRSTQDRPSSHGGRVRVLLETPDHQIVISEDAALNSWTWSFMRDDYQSFLYRSGKSHWISNKDGTTSPVADGVRTDEGWGTFFTPRRDVQYHLTLEVIEACAQPRPTYLLVKGGGWK